MNDAEREVLVERMAQRGCDRGDPAGISTWSALSEVAKEEWRLDMRAALAVAEPVLRADEREACIRTMKRRWEGGYPGEVIADLEAAIRARGDA